MEEKERSDLLQVVQAQVKSRQVETVDEVVQRGREAIRRLGRERILFTPDCGFATFADNPITAAEIAEAKLAVAVQAAEILKRASR